MPSNVIEVGPAPPGYVPTAPHVAGVVGWQAARAALQPPESDATGPSGARQSWAAGLQALQGVVAQSLSATHVAQRPLLSQTVPPLSVQAAPLGAFAVEQQPASQAATRQLALGAGQSDTVVQGAAHPPPVEEDVDVATPVSPELPEVPAELDIVPPVSGPGGRGFTEHADAVTTTAMMQAPTATYRLIKPPLLEPFVDPGATLCGPTAGVEGVGELGDEDLERVLDVQAQLDGANLDARRGEGGAAVCGAIRLADDGADVSEGG